MRVGGKDKQNWGKKIKLGQIRKVVPQNRNIWIGK